MRASKKKMGNAIRMLREFRDLTQAELAHEMGTRTWVVRLWGRDKLWPDANQFGRLFELAESSYTHAALLEAIGIDVPRLVYHLHSWGRAHVSPLTGRPLQCMNPAFWETYFSEMPDAELEAQWATTGQKGKDDHAYKQE